MVFSPLPRRWRFPLLGLATACTTIMGALGLPFSFVAAGYFAMYFLWAFRKELILDGAKRRYVWRDGIWPLMGQRRGSFDDFRWVALEAYELPPEEGKSVQDPPLQFIVSVAWNSHVGARPYAVAKSFDFATSAQIAHEIAQLADLSVVENLTLQDRRPELGPAAYDERILIPADNRPMSLVARLRG